MLLLFGGEGGSRTLARVAPPKALAKPPLRPLGYFSVPNYERIFMMPDNNTTPMRPLSNQY